MSINKAIIVGHIGKDPETKNVGADTVTNFSVATTESYKDKAGAWQKITEWHNVVAWKLHESLIKSLKKGSLVYVEGKMRTRTYEDKDKNKRYSFEIVSDIVRCFDKKESAQETTAAYAEQKETAAVVGGGSGQIDDDLPF